mmetsp:Transcript_16355/g.42159  ORF Transcript_16355/g.42159 Transcript_16355/m.42159 type:complete len:131 (-) Transcript_16355:28-420(-)
MMSRHAGYIFMAAIFFSELEGILFNSSLLHRSCAEPKPYQTMKGFMNSLCRILAVPKPYQSMKFGYLIVRPSKQIRCGYDVPTHLTSSNAVILLQQRIKSFCSFFSNGVCRMGTFCEVSQSSAQRLPDMS